jgi:AP-3 complex subunit beta
MVRPEDIRRQLDSRSLKDKLDAMKRVVALISLGRDASMFFPDVVKNVVAPSLDVKKLVYLYLVHYAEDKQDLALLSINSFQKDLSDHNQLIRALALRVLSSIRVKVILQIVIQAIAKCAADPSPYVRKTAAHAICKVCSLDAPSRDILLDPLALLLNDRSVQVLASAVAVLEEVAPEQFELVHPHFRHLCRSLPSMDPHGQVAVLRLLLRYGRSQFAECSSHASLRDPDLALLLSCVQPLFMSRNPSVVSSVVTMYYHLGSLEEVYAYATTPLMRLVSSGEESVRYVALRVAADIVLRAPGAILPFMSDFFVTVADGAPIRDQKLVILTRFCETAAHESGLSAYPQARRALLVEFRSYLGHVDKSLAAGATRALGCLASSHPPSTSLIIGILASVVAGSSNGVVVSESVTVLRRLLQLHPDSQSRALPKLVALLLVPRSDKSFIEAPQARAAIIWLIGEFYEKAPHVAPEVLRLLSLDFHVEAADVKLQILNLAAKVLAWQAVGRKSALEMNPVSFETRFKLLDYVTSSALFDKDYDVRDKARLFRHLFISNSWDTAKVLALSNALLNGTSKPRDKEVSTTLQQGVHQSSCGIELGASSFVLASMSHVIGHRLTACRLLPSWAPSNSASALREEDPARGRSGGGVLDVSSVGCAEFNHPARSDSVSNTSVFGNISSSGNGIQNGGMSSSGGLGYASGIKVNAQRAMPISADHFYDSESDADVSDGSYESESDDDTTANANTMDARQGIDGKFAIDESKAKNLLDTDDFLADLLQDTLLHSDLKPEQPRLVSGVSETSAKAQETSALGLLEGSNSVTDKSWHRIVESWNAGGIEVQICFVRGSFEGGTNATQLLLKLCNHSKNTLKTAAIVPLSPTLIISGQVSAFSLEPGQSIEISGFCLFAGKAVAVPFSVCSAGVALGQGEIRPTAAQLVRPLPTLSFDAFIKMEKSFGGMFGSSCQVLVPVPRDNRLGTGNSLDNVIRFSRRAILGAAFLSEVRRSPVAFSYPSALLESLLFAGYLPSGASSAPTDNNNILVRLRFAHDPSASAKASSCSGELWIGCENIVFSNNLLQILKRALSDSVAIDGGQ